MNEVSLVYEFLNYKQYLRKLVGSRNKRTGVKRAIADALRCQPTYISQILYSHANLSLEQAELLSEFLGHTDAEKHYFLLLIQKERAGTKSLREYFENQIQTIINKRLTVQERVGKKNKLSPIDQSIYYSSWHYAAIHIALTCPNLRTVNSLQEHLGISKKRVIHVLSFLCQSGLAEQKGKQFETGAMRMFLGKDSHNILKHHTNWRNKAIDSLERETLNDLHYSAVITLSRRDVVKLKENILKFIESSIKEIRESKEEELCSFTIDLFSLNHQ